MTLSAIFAAQAGLAFLAAFVLHRIVKADARILLFIAMLLVAGSIDAHLKGY